MVKWITGVIRGTAGHDLNVLDFAQQFVGIGAQLAQIHFTMADATSQGVFNIKNTLTGRISHGEVDLSELGANANELLSKVEHIQIVACGTSYNSGNPLHHG